MNINGCQGSPLNLFHFEHWKGEILRIGKSSTLSQWCGDCSICSPNSPSMVSNCVPQSLVLTLLCFSDVRVLSPARLQLRRCYEVWVLRLDISHLACGLWIFF